MPGGGRSECGLADSPGRRAVKVVGGADVALEIELLVKPVVQQGEGETESDPRRQAVADVNL